ncbi:MAG: retropepsin-like domain-containing protein, partial [Candidatus Eremiobacteraeota bacterium]|nr:retropepsin-like domain-containing protein [Candidatus Eremiobacteraeota bacterium]
MPLCAVALTVLLSGLRMPFPLAAVQPGPPALPAVTQIVENARRALGRLPSASAHWSGSIVEDGDRAHFDIVADREGRYRQVVSFALATRSEGSDGGVNWQLDENGDVETQSPARRVPLSARLLRLNQHLLGLSDKSSVSGSAVINEKPAYVVRAKFGADPITLYVDGASSLLAGADFQDGSVRYKAYRRFHGVPVPAIIEERQAGFDVTTTVEEVDFGAPVGDAAVVPIQRVPQFPAGRQSVALPFDSPRGLIVVRAEINGRPIKILLDSASSGSLIDAEAARRLGLQTAGTARVEGAG